MSNGVEPSGASPQHEIVRELGMRAQGAWAALRGNELVVLQRFVIAGATPSQAPGVRGGGVVSAESMAILLRDARCLAKNWHPNVTRVRHVDLVDGQLSIASELVDAVTLADLFEIAGKRRTNARETLVALPVLARIIVDVLGGLHGLHGLRDGLNTPLGMLHGELSPANVLVGKDGVARIAHVFRPRPVRIGPSSEGLAYASPETLAGELSQDARADLYSVGAILWEGLTGKRMYSDLDPARVARRQREEEISAPALPPGSPFARLADVAMRALSFDPAVRYRTASEMATEMRGIVGTRLAPGSVVAQTVVDLAGDRIRARRSELDKGSGAQRSARPPAAERVSLSPPRPPARRSSVPPPRAPRAPGSPTAPSRPPPRPQVDSLDDLPGPRTTQPNLANVTPTTTASKTEPLRGSIPDADALGMAAAMEVSVGVKSLVEPSSPPPPPVDPPAPAAAPRDSSGGASVAVLSVGPVGPEIARRKRFVPLVLAITGVALLLLLVAGVASMRGTTDEASAATRTVSVTTQATTQVESPSEPPPAPAPEEAPSPPAELESGPAAVQAPATSAIPAAAATTAAPQTNKAPDAPARALPAPPPPRRPKKAAFEPLGI